MLWAFSLQVKCDRYKVELDLVIKKHTFFWWLYLHRLSYRLPFSVIACEPRTLESIYLPLSLFLKELPTNPQMKCTSAILLPSLRVQLPLYTKSWEIRSSLLPLSIRWNWLTVLLRYSWKSSRDKSGTWIVVFWRNSSSCWSPLFVVSEWHFWWWRVLEVVYFWQFCTLPKGRIFHVWQWCEAVRWWFWFYGCVWGVSCVLSWRI